MAERRFGSRSSDEVEDGTGGPPTDTTSEGGWTFATQAHYDPTEPRDLTTVVVGAIAEAESVPITGIKVPPLYEVVDVAGIDDALFGRPDVARNGTESTVEFRYLEYKVSVEADGWVTVHRFVEGPTAK